MAMTDAPIPSAEPAEAATALRSRRSLLAAAAGGATALVALLTRPARAQAAAGDALIIGSEANNAGTNNTQLIANSNVVTFKLYQTGPGTALMGYTTTATGTTRGVYGRVDSPNGDGVQGRNAGAAGTGVAVRAIGVNNTGLEANTDNNERYAVLAVNNGAGGNAVRGQTNGGIGVRGDSTSFHGVAGVSDSGRGVYGFSVSGSGVYGYSVSSYAGYFSGQLYAISAHANIKAFRIDHPLDPANKVLMHSCVESNERLTVYAGTVTTDAAGEATVALPGYFGALNRELRYQLTVIGSFAQAMVKAKVADNRFTIATSEPGTEVCWQVTGERADAYATAHPLVVESAKVGREQGRYLTPLEHGQPESAGVDYEERQPVQAHAEPAAPSAGG